MVRQGVQDGAGRPGGAHQVRGLPVVRGQGPRRVRAIRGGRDAGHGRPRDRRQDGHGPAQGRPDVRVGGVLPASGAPQPAGESNATRLYARVRAGGTAFVPANVPGGSRRAKAPVVGLRSTQYGTGSLLCAHVDFLACVLQKPNRLSGEPMPDVYKFGSNYSILNRVRRFIEVYIVRFFI